MKWKTRVGREMTRANSPAGAGGNGGCEAGGCLRVGMLQPSAGENDRDESSGDDEGGYDGAARLLGGSLVGNAP